MGEENEVEVCEGFIGAGESEGMETWRIEVSSNSTPSHVIPNVVYTSVDVIASVPAFFCIQ